MPDRQVWSVSQVNLFIKNLLDETPQLSGLLVRGELSNYKVYPSGHHYFTLKDSEGAMRCVMFRGAASKLRFRPENGMQVIVSGRVGVYPRDGAYQFYCTSLSADGIGDLLLAQPRLLAQGQQPLGDHLDPSPSMRARGTSPSRPRRIRRAPAQAYALRPHRASKSVWNPRKSSRQGTFGGNVRGVRWGFVSTHGFVGDGLVSTHRRLSGGGRF